MMVGRGRRQNGVRCAMISTHLSRLRPSSPFALTIIPPRPRPSSTSDRRQSERIHHRQKSRRYGARGGPREGVRQSGLEERERDPARALAAARHDLWRRRSRLLVIESAVSTIISCPTSPTFGRESRESQPKERGLLGPLATPTSFYRTLYVSHAFIVQLVERALRGCLF